MSETVSDIVAAHRSGAATPEDTVRRTYERIRAYDDPAIFITLRDEPEALAEARDLMNAGPEGKPLYGVPVAIKDNIDVAGLPTTAACPAFAYMAGADATAVTRLRRAGAIVIGKTNLDQFATGLVGVRSPYGAPRNPFRADLISGGSSSGSAAAVAAGLVPIALGTDTAGSGRVPAGLNNIVGLKPSVGLVSTTGVVPACRSLDCVSIFALTVDDAFTALQAMAIPDASDPYSRVIPVGTLGAAPPSMVVAVPDDNGRLFFGDTNSEQSFRTAIALLRNMGATIKEIDVSPLLETARLLYEGPWVAERYAAVGAFIEKYPDKIHPVTREIIAGGAKISAADTFRSFYRLAALKRTALEIFSGFDVLMVPTVPAAYTKAQLEADPITLNSNLGTYTNFVNLLDLCGLAVPVSFASDGTPYGATFLARSGRDAALASLGRVLHAQTELPLGALGVKQPVLAPLAPVAKPGEILIAVVGAHLSGMPLNGELRALNARFVEETQTAADYRLYALANTTPPKPGMLRVAQGQGAAIALEVWALSADGFGRFVAGVPSPLSIGTLRLADGRQIHGFLVEPIAVEGARDISDFGGWRAFVEQRR
ncbi:allophanate hydrolase [Pseudorhodoplanes sp.]|uniref:allophanate hydrolase n=1 Tax=Pseudorhodoplanes sp. TaxID=1934341 RepID=UPI002CD4B8B1|nr:allophanate hydrolase [Pseudorhodoplanes sp.]HWV52043.1 allophanate hydrolase [Pseudorhodoplanes sp.]